MRLRRSSRQVGQYLSFFKGNIKGRKEKFRIGARQNPYRPIFIYKRLFLHCILLLVEFLSYVAKSIRYTLASRKNLFSCNSFFYIQLTLQSTIGIFLFIILNPGFFNNDVSLNSFFTWILEAFFVLFVDWRSGTDKR